MAEIGRLTVFGFATSKRSLTDKKDLRVSWERGGGFRPLI